MTEIKTMYPTGSKFWCGVAPTECDVAKHSIFPERHDISETFVDGATSLGGWAFLCLNCHRTYGRGLGMGRGQQYTKQPDGKWLKTGG